MFKPKRNIEETKQGLEARTKNFEREAKESKEKQSEASEKDREQQPSMFDPLLILTLTLTTSPLHNHPSRIYLSHLPLPSPITAPFPMPQANT